MWCMAEIRKSEKCFCIKKDAFILYPVLLMFMIFSLWVNSYCYIQTINMKIMQRNKEMIQRFLSERKVIERIREEFYNYENKNFTMLSDGCLYQVKYRKMRATIQCSGRFEFKSYLSYNDSYGTVKDYGYYDLSENEDLWKEDDY